MKNIFQNFTNKFFGDRLDFRAKIFNAVMLIMVVTWTIGGSIAVMSARGESLAGVPALVGAGLVAILILYANKSGNYRCCYWIVTVALFMVQMPIGFFLNGGYKNSGSFVVFILSVTITAFLFEGKKAIIVPMILIIEYTALYVYAYYYPDSIIMHSGEREQFLFNTLHFVLVCVILSTFVILHLRLHDKQKRELEDARRIAENAYEKAVEYEKMKSEFFADMSHELRTPLTIMSASAQLAVKQIKSNDISKQTLCDLDAISQETTRLADMTDCALKTLTMPFESGGVECLEHKHNFTPTHIGTLVEFVSGVVKPVAIQKGKSLQVCIDEEIPMINGDKDTLIRLMLNLLHNAVNHGGESIIIRGNKVGDDDKVILTVENDGAGIPQELLDNIFDRGVSGGGGAGLGLYICKKIVQAHGGDIRIENIESGVRVTVTLPKGYSS